MDLEKQTEAIITELIRIGYKCPFIYGSWNTFCLYKYDDKLPNDIDVINIVPEEYEEGEFSVKLDCIDIPVNIECMTLNHLRVELMRGDVKYYTIGFGTIVPKCANHLLMYLGHIGSVMMTRRNSEIRKICSTASDKAFNKGKKKLTVLEDYDKMLGLKNIWHSIHFIYIITHYYNLYRSNTEHEMNIASMKQEFDVLEMLNIRDNIYKIYDETYGDYHVKAQAVIDYAKPIRNKLMTEFRKLYPKEDV